MADIDWEKIKKVWKPGNKHAEGFLYIGDAVRVIKGKKVPIGTVGTITRMLENHYDKNSSSYDIAKGTLMMTTFGYKIEPIQFTNARIALELSNGDITWTYLNNVEKV